MTVRGGIPLTFEDTDLAALLAASLGPLLAQAAADRIELRVVTLGEPVVAPVDREKIAWCVTTLVGNALRYLRKGDESTCGGSVIVHVAADDEHPDLAAVSVHDDGPGIPDDKLPYLFERRRGALHAEGLGLDLVREIVAAHGGRIRLESLHGPEEHGTSITLRLPRAPRGSPAPT